MAYSVEDEFEIQFCSNHANPAMTIMLQIK